MSFIEWNMPKDVWEQLKKHGRLFGAWNREDIVVLHGKEFKKYLLSPRYGKETNGNHC